MLAGRNWPAALCTIADPALLEERAQALAVRVDIEVVAPGQPVPRHRAGRLACWPVQRTAATVCGRPDPANARYVLAALDRAIDGCLGGELDALVTGPVQKSVINDAGHSFSGHTEFLADLTHTRTPVMMLVAGRLRVALVTTHLPLRSVPAAITKRRLTSTLRVLERDLREKFGCARPRILVCGLNPHAGESGHLGREEIDVIEPVIADLQGDGMDLIGPLPADTLFVPARLADADAVLAMYHDQGLPVLKHAGFGEAVNVTLGLPIIRTSVDHGTALDLAGTGRADEGSLQAAVELAIALAQLRHATKG